MSESNKPNFEYGKTIGIADCMYGDFPFMINMIGKLLNCMKESNQINGKDNEYFRLDFRPPTYYELTQYPRGSLILDLKWGCKKEEVGEDG
jgi:hypothetical protein